MCYNYYITSYHSILMIVVNLVCFYVLFNLKVLRSSLHKFVVADEVFCSTEPSVSMLKYDTFRLPHEHDSDVSDKVADEVFCSTEPSVSMLKYDTFRLPHEHDSDVSDKCSTDSCVDI